MNFLPVIFIIGRIITSPLANVFQKKLTNKKADPLFIVFITYLMLTILSTPVFYAGDFNWHKTDSNFWFYISMMALFDTTGNIFLVRSLKHIDLSIFGPLNAFKPVVASIIAIFLLHEIPTLPGIIGLFIIISGSYLLQYSPGKPLKINKTGVLFRFAAIIFTSLGAVFSKKAILLSSSLPVMLLWGLTGIPLLLAFLLFKKRNYLITQIKIVKKSYLEYAGVTISILLMQYLTFLTFKYIFVGYSLALFQLSSLISVLFGLTIFNEKNIKIRFAGAAIMVAGAVLVLI